MTKNRFSIKESIGKNNKLTKAISLLFLVFVMLGLFAFIIIGLSRFGLIEFPQFIHDLFWAADSGGFTVEVTLENIRELIAGAKPPDALHMKMTANYYINGQVSRTEDMSVWKKGDKHKYTLSVNGAAFESYINDSKNEQIENFATGDKLKRKPAAAFSFDNIPHMPSINYYLGLLESGEITDYSITQNESSNVAEIKYELAKLDQWEIIHISLDTGLVQSVRCYTGRGELYYECAAIVDAAYYGGDAGAEAAMPFGDELFEVK